MADEYENDSYDSNEEFSEDNEEVSSEEEEETKKISVWVKKGDVQEGLGKEICIDIDNDIELRWLMIHYCDKLGIDYNKTKFLFNGARLKETDTPLQLSMLHNDVIFVFPFYEHQGVHGRNAACYETLCIRMHKKRDTFLRVTRTKPLLYQLNRHFSNGVAEPHVSTCFVFNGLRLTEDHTVEKLKMEDGDIIDAFDFDESSTSLSINRIINPISQSLTVEVRNLSGEARFYRSKGSTCFKNVADVHAKYLGFHESDMHKLAFVCDRRDLSLDKPWRSNTWLMVVKLIVFFDTVFFVLVQPVVHRFKSYPLLIALISQLFFFWFDECCKPVRAALMLTLIEFRP